MSSLTEFNKVDLTDNYNKSSYRNDFNQHIVTVLDLAYKNTKSKALIDPNMKFSKSLYWECLNTIYEENYVEKNDEEKENNRLLRENLYTNIIKKLGSFFNINSEALLETIDFTISNYMDSINFNLESINPWEFSNKIFLDSNLLYTFSDNIDEFQHLIKNKKESIESKYQAIGILCKGNREDYVQKYIKDIYAVRNLFLNILDEKNYDRYNPINIYDIYKLFRSLGISKDDLSDSNIKYWIVMPLKEQIKIGSNKNGYFLIRTADDLQASYESHYKKFLGLHKTLNKHRHISFKDYPEINIDTFESHFLKNE